MSRSVKLSLYKAAKASGLFWACRRATAQKLRVLAYHGFSSGDEVKFRDKLFISPETFSRRLRTLSDQGYPVLPLGEALDRLDAGTLQPASVVITIDDGYASTLESAAPLLRSHGFPATVYLTSYHMRNQTPVFDLMVAYLAWKSKATEAALPGPAGGQELRFDLAGAGRDRMIREVTALGHTLGTESERVALCRSLAAALGVDYDEVASRQAFRLMTPEEARSIQNMGVEIGLHTHRHRFPTEDLTTCTTELQDNIEYLLKNVGVSPLHFCYPSGVYSKSQWPVLSAFGLASATTCDTGLVTRGDSRFGLKRFLDGESVSDIEFEAEICGFAETLRHALRVDRHAPGAKLS